MGIIQLSYFVRFFGGLIALIIKLVEAKKFQLFEDIPRLFKILILVKPTFKDFGNVWDEFRDLDDLEKEELKSILALEVDLDLSNEEHAAIAKLALDKAIDLLQLISSFRRQ